MCVQPQTHKSSSDLTHKHSCKHTQMPTHREDPTSCMIKPGILGDNVLSYCQILFNNIAKSHKDPEAIMFQLLEKGPPLFFLPFSTLNHLHAFTVKANTELIHSQMPLQWRSSFKRTHKSSCACVWEYGNASPSRPFSSLMRNIPWVMALAASKMGNPYLPRGSSAG